MANQKYLMTRIHREEQKLIDGKVTKVFTVQWVNYPNAKDYTEETEQTVKNVNGFKLISEFRVWRSYVAQCQEGRREPLTRNSWEKSRTKKAVGANPAGTCVLQALRRATDLLGQPGFFAKDRVDSFVSMGKGCATDMTLDNIVQLIKHCNFEQGKLGLPTIPVVGMRRGNCVKGTQRGCIQMDLRPGVYFCIGVTDAQVRHAFVLEWSSTAASVIHDLRIGKKPMPYDANTTKWIDYWSHVVKLY